jgi:uncharacterized protein
MGSTAERELAREGGVCRSGASISGLSRKLPPEALMRGRTGGRDEHAITNICPGFISGQNFLAADPQLAKADIGAQRAYMTMREGTKDNLTRQAILRALRRNDELLEKYAVRRIALFGSYATGRQSRKSDLDFLVDFEQPTYTNFLGLSRDLERLFGRKVEILTPQGLESIRVKSIAESIRRTLAYV